MKKFIVMIFALATILALTVIPASALSWVEADLDKSGETWIQVEESTGDTVYVKFEYDGELIEEGTKVAIVAFNRGSPLDAGAINNIEPGKHYFEELNKVYVIGFYAPYSEEFTVPVNIYIQNDGANKLFYGDTVKYSESKDEDANIFDYICDCGENTDITLTTPDDEEASFSMMTTNCESYYMFFSPNAPVPTKQNGSGSIFLNSPAWFIISIAELVAVVALSVVLVTKSKKVKS